MTLTFILEVLVLKPGCTEAGAQCDWNQVREKPEPAGAWSLAVLRGYPKDRAVCLRLQPECVWSQHLCPWEAEGEAGRDRAWMKGRLHQAAGRS